MLLDEFAPTIYRKIVKSKERVIAMNIAADPTQTPVTIDSANRVQESMHHALHSAAWYRLPASAGLLEVTDSDRVDFLQRMTTNNIATLRATSDQSGDSTVTILTSPTARIVQVFTVLARAESLWLLPAPTESATLARHLRGQIFFLDKVKVQDLSDGWRRAHIIGPNAISLLENAGITLPAGDNRWAASDGILAVRESLYGIPGVELLVPAEEFETFAMRLVEAGAPEIESPEAIDALRVALGRPAPGAELTTDYSPLEVEMAWACSENKGCYTGQEIIARQRTYDKVTRTLVGLRSEQMLEPGASLFGEGREVGKITSAARHPVTGAPIALAVVKRPANTPGTHLLCDEQGVEVVALPLV